MRVACLFLAAAQILCGATYAQDPRALVRLRVADTAMDKVLELHRRKAPKTELKELKVHQPYTLVLSGVAISDNEILTTALHPRARLRIQVTFHDGTKHKGVVVGTDPRSNLALVRVAAGVKFHLELAAFAVAAKQNIRIDGHKRGLAFKSTGIVARQSMAVALRDFYCVNGGRPIKLGSVFMVATTAGGANSGSACFDDTGRFVGIVIGSMPSRAVGAMNPPPAVYHLTFVVPTTRIVRVVDHLRKYGRVVRSYFGVSLLPVERQVHAHFRLPASASVIVKVWDRSPASAAGLRRHDIVVSVNGETVSNTYHLGELMGDAMPGTSMTLRVLRNGKQLDVTILPVERK